MESGEESGASEFIIKAKGKGILPTSITSSGNVAFMHLFIDGLSIQPCEPSFVTGRDAILQADQNRYSGDHFCIIWRVFASRGLGFGAAEDNSNNFPYHRDASSHEPL